jgi:hypothetical protein
LFGHHAIPTLPSLPTPATETGATTTQKPPDKKPRNTKSTSRPRPAYPPKKALEDLDIIGGGHHWSPSHEFSSLVSASLFFTRPLNVNWGLV